MLFLDALQDFILCRNRYTGRLAPEAIRSFQYRINIYSIRRWDILGRCRCGRELELERRSRRWHPWLCISEAANRHQGQGGGKGLGYGKKEEYAAPVHEVTLPVLG